MFAVNIDEVEPNCVMRYLMKRDDAALSFSEVLDLLRTDPKFQSYITQVLADSPFSAYRWETPGLTISNLSQPFQFVLLNAPEFASRPTDRISFKEHFTTDDKDDGVIAFTNLGGDAMLVVPSPRADSSAYGHLAAFIRNAPARQVHSFWRIVSETVQARISEAPLWLSTAGGGVAWLHARLDARPKYYGYAPYRTAVKKNG